MIWRRVGAGMACARVVVGEVWWMRGDVGAFSPTCSCRVRRPCNLALPTALRRSDTAGAPCIGTDSDRRPACVAVSLSHTASGRAFGSWSAVPVTKHTGRAAQGQQQRAAMRPAAASWSSMHVPPAPSPRPFSSLCVSHRLPRPAIVRGASTSEQNCAVHSMPLRTSAGLDETVRPTPRPVPDRTRA